MGNARVGEVLMEFGDGLNGLFVPVEPFQSGNSDHVGEPILPAETDTDFSLRLRIVKLAQIEMNKAQDTMSHQSPLLTCLDFYCFKQPVFRFCILSPER